MSTLSKIGLYTSFVVGLSGIVGCPQETMPPDQKKKAQPGYFAKFPVAYHGAIAITNGDFDGDGDLDLIVGTKSPSESYIGELRLYLNDGKGNFILYKPKTE